MIPSVSLQRLHGALTDAFSRDELEILLRLRLDVRLDHIAAPGSMDATAFSVIEYADRVGWLQDLVEAAYQERPRNPGLAALYRDLGLAPAVSVQRGGLETVSGGFESMVQVSGGFESVVGHQKPDLDLDVWTPAAARVSDRVCRIEDDGQPVATGFLVGPDAVLTCDFVFKKLLSGEVDPGRYAFRFDYKVLADGTRSDGLAVGLHPTNWLIDVSPHAPADLAGPGSAGPPPTPDQLGYALVRLARPVGSEPPARAVGGPPRGWVRFPAAPPPLLGGTCVVVAHYPRGEPFKLTVDAEGLIGPNVNGTRLWYSASTQPGSSGAPCFDDAWNLLAVHQGQDWQGRGQGVVAAAIRYRLTQLNKAAALGGDGN